jgi:tRNA threonylcarbamoyladenosine biosynthesis protein TsaB
MASRYWRFASKYCRMAGVEPAGSDDTGGEDISGRFWAKYNIGILIILSLDPTTRAGSVAALRDTDVLAELTGDPERTHGERLPEDLMRVLRAASLRIEEVELFAVAAGPGSFTGLRVGIATAQGLAMARARRVVAVSALEALARAAADQGAPIAAWMDAQRGEVFSELYTTDARTTIGAAESVLPGTLLDRWRHGVDGATPVFVGDGAVRYRTDITAALGEATRILHPPPLAGLIGHIAASHPERAVLPHAVVPIYIRRPDAELARTRRAAGG